MFNFLKSTFSAALVLSLAVSVAGCGGSNNNNDGTDTGNDPGTDLHEGPNNLPTVCPNIVELTSGMNIKYKSQNVHGGRGPSWIMGCGAWSQWPVSNYLANFPIYSALGNEIGRFVVYDPGHRPYGNRSYTGLPGGYPADSTTLINSALGDAGVADIYVNVKGNVCYHVSNPTVDTGAVNAVSGKGGC